MEAKKLKFAALISGGKDSVFSVLSAILEGHTLVAVAHLKPRGGAHEANSHFYQSVGHRVVPAIAECFGVPFFQREVTGGSRNLDLDYTETADDEVEDMLALLLEVKNDTGAEAVTSGAIDSTFQRLRVENVCARLGMLPLAYLWRRCQHHLLAEMVRAGVGAAVVVKCATLGLEPRHLGRSVFSLRALLDCLENPCGEGGEFETLTLEAPWLRRRVRLTCRPEVVTEVADDRYPTVYLKIEDGDFIVEDRDHIPNEEHELARLGRIILTTHNSLAWLRCQAVRLLHESPLDNVEVKSNDLYLDRVAASPRSAVRAPEPCDISTVSSGTDGIFHVDGTLFLRGGSLPPELGSFVTEMFRRVSAASPVDRLVMVRLYVNVAHLAKVNFASVNNAYVRLFRGGTLPARLFVFVHLPERVLLALQCTGYGEVGSPATVAKLSNGGGEPGSYGMEKYDVERASESNQSKTEASSTEVPLVQHMSISDSSESPSGVSRKFLLVRSVSHWAPVPIGPYSQACRVTSPETDDPARPIDAVYVAGQIPLVPGLGPDSPVRLGSWANADSDSTTTTALEVALALRHACRVLEDLASPPGRGSRHAEGLCREWWRGLSAHATLLVCYATTARHIGAACTLLRRTCGLEPTRFVCVYVVVPGLPRGARVEFEVAGVSNADSFLMDEHQSRGTERTAAPHDGGDYPGLEVCVTKNSVFLNAFMATGPSKDTKNGVISQEFFRVIDPYTEGRECVVESRVFVEAGEWVDEERFLEVKRCVDEYFASRSVRHVGIVIPVRHISNRNCDNVRLTMVASITYC